MYKDNKGYEYEEIAKRYLTDNNYYIIEQNFTSRFGEIDIIAKNNDTLCFIEVKGRRNTEFGMPREAVSIKKQRKIIMAAKFFLSKGNYEDLQCRFDVIEIIFDDKKINYIENAFWT